MPAVITLPYFDERIRLNPSNRDRLLAMDPKEFVRVMNQWQADAHVEPPGIGLSPAELSSITASAVIISGNNDIHPRKAADALHGFLSRSEFHPYQLTSDEETSLTDPQESQNLVRRRNYSIFCAFLEKVEAAAALPRE